jgi:hypothetical protein
MALNLIRNSKVFFTTNIATSTGIINPASTTAFSSSNTYEIQVLDGFSFSQNSNAEQVTVSEAGVAPVRGQRSFNTSLAPVDFSFSTYIRPSFSTNVLCEESLLWNALLGSDTQNSTLAFTGTLGTFTYTQASGELNVVLTGGTSTIAVGDKVLVSGLTTGATGTAKTNDERILNGPGTVKTVTGTTPSITGVVITMDNQVNSLTTTPGALNNSTISTTNFKLYTSAWGAAPNQSIAAGHRSNTNQLQKFGMLFLVDNVLYAVDNCALNEATIDFGLDGIATIAWTGQATALRQFATGVTASGGTFSNGSTADVGSGGYTQKVTGANYITNKLSTCRLKTAKTLGGGTFAVTPYYLALTGGSITISNNITYITPAILGIVNQAITYYTGTRSITGTLNAYLNTGTLTGISQDGVNVTKGTGELLKDLLAVAATETEPMFYIELAIGGTSNAVRVELQMPSVSIGTPAINTEQVVSTAITFTAAPSTGAYSARTYDLTQTNELTVRYYST